MAIPIQFIPEIPESKLSSSVQTKLNSSGGESSNPNIIVVTTEAELYNASNSNKIMSIQSNITLTANRVLANNVILVDEGGAIISGGYTLTGVNTKVEFRPNKVFLDFYTGVINGTWKLPSTFELVNIGAKEGGAIVYNGLSITAGSNIVTSSSYTFTSADIGKKCAIVGAGTAGKVHNATITAVSPNVTLSANAVATVSNKNGTVSWDNQTAVRNALALLNASGGSSLIGNNKTYYHSTVALEAQDYNDPTNWTIKGDNHTLKNVSFQLIPHDLVQTETLVIDKATNTTLENVHLIGDLEIHPTEGVGKTEGNYGYVWRTLAKNTIFLNCYASWYYGDGGIGKGDNQFTNYIDGVNMVGPNTASTVAVGSISRIDGITIDAANISKIYTEGFLDIDKSQFTNQLETGYPNKSYKLSGRSFSGWGGLKTPYYTAFYYDEAKTTLLYVSPIQYIYDEIPIREEWKFVRFEFDYPSDLNNIELMAAPRITANGLNWKGGEIYSCGRDGISNPPNNSTFEDIYIHDIGFLTAGPGYGINAEDARRSCRNLSIINCRFRDNWGAISIIGAENVLIQGNTVLPNTRDLSKAPTNYPHAGIDTDYGRNVRWIGNTTYEVSNSVDRQDLVTGNTFIGGDFTYTANDNTVTGNTFTNVVFKEIQDVSANRVGYPTIFKNNKMNFSKSTGNNVYFNDKEYKASFIDNDFNFNYFANYSNLATSNTTINFGYNTNDRLFRDNAPVTHFGGFFKGNSFKGAKPHLSERDYDTGNAFFPLNNFNNNLVGTSVEFRYDVAKDYLSEGNIINGFVNFDLRAFPTVLPSVVNKIVLKDYKIIVNSDYNWTSNSAALLRVPRAIYVNFEIYNSVFDLQVESTVLPTVSNRYLSLKSLGTYLFDKCTFKSVTPKVINFLDTGIFAAGIQVTIKDPILDGSITFNGAKLLFTTPNQYCPSYADNATALAALGEGWYYKNTTSGKFDITNL